MTISEEHKLVTDASLKELAHSIRAGASVLFITGAGLSVASGIAPYRGTKNAIWSKFVVDWGTKKKFKKNPEQWWNQYWLKTHETLPFLNARPNAGHHAIANLSKMANVRVITQNIDRLHHRTSLNPDYIVEIHGRLGYYKCINSNCIYNKNGVVDQIDYSQVAVNGTSLEQANLQIDPPLCPNCSDYLMPLSLFFDETYNSHDYYNWETAAKWMVDYDCMVFVGTSFSVGITQTALEIAASYGKPVYSFNLFDEHIDVIFDLSNVHHVIGKAEVSLPTLFRYVSQPGTLLYRIPPYIKRDTALFLQTTHYQSQIDQKEEESNTSAFDKSVIIPSTIRRRTPEEEILSVHKTFGPLNHRRGCVCGSCIHVPLHLPSLLPSNVSTTHFKQLCDEDNQSSTQLSYAEHPQSSEEESFWNQIKDQPVDFDDPEQIDFLFSKLQTFQPTTSLPHNHLPVMSPRVTTKPHPQSQPRTPPTCDVCGILSTTSSHDSDGIEAYSHLVRPTIFIQSTRYFSSAAVHETKTFPLQHPIPNYPRVIMAASYGKTHSIPDPAAEEI